MVRQNVLAFIPARAESKRILQKNIRRFAGKPLLAHTIAQSRASSVIGRTVVSTESPEIAALARKFGAEVPFLRPKRLATGKSNVADAITYTLERLKKEEGYEPEYFVILQTTSPLRSLADIEECYRYMQKTKATTVLTVAPTHPKFYHVNKKRELELVNGNESGPWRTQDWPPGYLLTGSVYVVNTKAFLREGIIITKHTKAVVVPKWRSVDLDDPEEWAVAELLYAHGQKIEKTINTIEGEKRRL